MKGNQITDHYSNHPVLPELIETINNDRAGKIRIGGLSGSARALILSLVFHKTQTTHMVIVTEKEDAAYFYNDLVALLGEESVFFFPSTYKRSVQYEQTEPANIVLRTEVLNHLASGKRKGIVVTYPESVMEKVVSRKNLKKKHL
jgi:transcription-repair coupling factor (superfamily II helicase)